MKYEIKSNSLNGSFELLENNKTLFQLTYDNWFSTRAVVNIDNLDYEVKPSDFWGSKFQMNKGDLDLGYFKFNWKGNAILFYKKHELLLNYKGLLNTRFELQNKNENILLVLKPNLKWSKLEYGYEIESSEEFESIENKKELLLLVSYATNVAMNYYMMGI